jgi:catechol 2,3-dioxygenase-like lactoylglutathione lyase family enzyme
MPALSQVALSVTDLERSVDWYRRVLGMRPTGSTRLFRGPLMARIIGIPNPVSRCAWAVDSQRRFQLELFEFERPIPKWPETSADRGGVGYRSMVVKVNDFDLARSQGGLSTSVTGEPGDRRATLEDPDGNPIVIVEAESREPGRSRSRNGIGCAVRGVVVSVPDLERSRRFFGATLGLRETDGCVLHRPGARPPGLDGSVDDLVTYWADDIAVEVVQQSKADPWPDGYRLCDVGFLNVAFAFPSRSGFRHAANRIARSGHRLLSRPVDLGIGGVVYIEDDQGFSVELGYQSRFAAMRLGFLE